MSAYLVRLKKSHDPVGLIVADNLEELADTIDEIASPYECEYVKLRRGGIVFPGQTVTRWDIEAADDDGDGFDVNGRSSLTEMAGDAIFTAKEWKACIGPTYMQGWTPGDEEESNEPRP